MINERKALIISFYVMTRVILNSSSSYLTQHATVQRFLFMYVETLYTFYFDSLSITHLYTLKEHFTSKFKSNSLFPGILSFEATADKVQNVRITKLKACFVVSVLFYSCLFIMRMWQNLHHFCCEASEIFFFVWAFLLNVLFIQGKLLENLTMISDTWALIFAPY